MFHLGQVVGEEEETEQVGDEDQAGMALEGWIGTGEGNFAKADQHNLYNKNDASDQDGNVKQGGGPSPEK